MSNRLGGIIGCKYKTSSWHLNGFPVLPFILDVRFVGVTAGVTQEEGHTRFLHLPSAVLALIFLARRIRRRLVFPTIL